MSSFELLRYTDEARDVWDTVVKNSKNGNFLHLRNYLDYHAHRFDEKSVLVLRNSKPVAVFPCNRVEKIIISHGGLTYGGLIYGGTLHAAEILNVFHMLCAYYRRYGIERLIYKAIPHIFHRYPAEEDLYALFRLNAKLYRRDISSVIRIKNRIEFSDSRKNTIRKARKMGIEIAEGDFFDQYHDLLSSVLVKFDSQPVHTLEELEFLKSRFTKEIRLFCAFKKDQLLAGAIVYDFGNVVHTQYLANSDAGRKMGALDLILSYLIESVFENRRYFSFGISTERDGEYLNEGLIFHKEGFGGRGVAHDFYELEI